MTRVYIDANVVLYAIGAPSEYREPCRAAIEALGRRALVGETSAATIEEVVHHRRRRADADATNWGRSVAELCSVVHPVDRDIGLAALDLVDGHPQLDTGDAIHAATAIAAGLAVIVSADKDFDRLPAITRVDPRDRAAMARIAKG